jgi:hypothetical protein
LADCLDANVKGVLVMRLPADPQRHTAVRCVNGEWFVIMESSKGSSERKVANEEDARAIANIQNLLEHLQPSRNDIERTLAAYRKYHLEGSLDFGLLQDRLEE